MRKRLQILRTEEAGDIANLWPDIRDLGKAFPDSKITITPEKGRLVLRCQMPVK